MHVPAVHRDDPDVARIQATWHCLLRFRQRFFRTPGASDAIEALRAALADAEVARVPPGWAAGQQAERWAIAGELAFPLARDAFGGDGAWIALTCLHR